MLCMTLIALHSNPKKDPELIHDQGLSAPESP